MVKRQLADVCVGAGPLDVPGLNERMARACRNLGRSGLVACAISAVDIALWDLKARLLEVPLTALFGQVAADVPDLRQRWLHHLRRGHDPGPARAVGRRVADPAGEDQDRRVVGQRYPDGTWPGWRWPAEVVGDDVELYVDANGGYTRKQAVRMGRAFHEEHGVTWFEEPVSSDDLAGLREVRDNCGGRRGRRGVRLQPRLFRPHGERRRGRLRAGRRHPLRRLHRLAAGGERWRRPTTCRSRATAPPTCTPTWPPRCRTSAIWSTSTTTTASRRRSSTGPCRPDGGQLVPATDRPGHGLTLRRADADEVPGRLTLVAGSSRRAHFSTDQE